MDLDRENMEWIVVFLLLVNLNLTHGNAIEINAGNGKCLLVGEKLELSCSFINWDERHEPDLQQLHIIHMDKKMEITVFNSSMAYDKRAIQVVVPNMGIDDSGKYSCHYKNNGLSLTKSLFFEVTEPGPMPNDMECISTGNTIKVICTWTSQDKCSTWRLFYSLNGKPEAECVIPRKTIPGRCSDNSIRSIYHMRTKCQINELVQWACHLKNFRGNYTFRLQRNTSFGHMTKEVIEKRFDDTIVKLDRLRNFQVHITSQTLTFDWQFRYYPNYYDDGIHCRLTCGEETKALVFGSNDTRLNVTGIEFGNLRPFTTYKVMVKCQVAGSRYWGDPIENSYLTEEDVPLVGPDTTRHSYTLERCEADRNHNCLNIHVKPVDALKARGLITGYDVVIRGSSRSILKQQRFEFSITPTTLELELDDRILPPFNVSIWSKTSKGLSIRSTDVFINPKMDDDIIQEVIVEEEDSHYLVTAKLSPAFLPSPCIFHWCYGVQSFMERVICKKGYEYRNSSRPELRIRKTELDRPAPMAEDEINGRWYFAASFSTETGSTGVHWEDCTFGAGDYGQSPSQPDRPLLTEGIHNQILVAVQPFCSPEKVRRPRPMNYTVICVNVDDADDEYTKIFEARLKNDLFELDNLTPGSTYKVTYNIGYRQSISLFSEPAFKNTAIHSNSQKISKIVGLAVGTTVFLVIIVTMIWKLVRYYQKIEQPIEGVEIDNDEGKDKCWSDDTGIGSHSGDDRKSMGSESGESSFHCTSKFSDTKPRLENKSSSDHASHIYSSLYRINDSFSNEKGLDVNSVSSDKLETSEDIVEFGNEPSSNNIITPENVSGNVNEQVLGIITMQCQFVLPPDVALNATGNEQRSTNGRIVNTQTHSSNSIPTSDAYSERAIMVDNTKEALLSTDYMPMARRSRRFSDVTLDEYDISVILLDANDTELDSKNDCSWENVGDFLTIPSNPCTERESASQPTKTPERTSRSEISGYKQLLREKAKVIQNDDQVSPKTTETHDGISTSKAHIRCQSPASPENTMDDQLLDNTSQLDDSSVKEEIHDPIVRQVDRFKDRKTGYKSLPLNQERAEAPPNQ